MGRSFLSKLVTFLLILMQILFCIEEIDGARQRYVTYGSVIKLFNSDYRVRLHSHDVKYGTGSGQQSVTGTEVQEDVNSHWFIKARTGKYPTRGEEIKCGATIRLEHLQTHKNLHSHHFQSPLSGNQEISCYGDDHGEGDTGDHWTVICSGEFWSRDDSIMFKHVDTDVYLAASGRTFGRPINGQMEIIGLHTPSGSVHWQTMEGVFIHPPDISAKQVHNPHTELLAMRCSGCNRQNKQVKNIRVYINGRRTENYKIVLDSKRYKTWHTVLNEITNKINPDFGIVKKLYSADSGITICSLSDIEDNGTYVASDSKKFQIVKGGYTENIIKNYYEHYLSCQLERKNKTKKLSYVRSDLLVIYVFSNGKENKLPEKVVLSKRDLQNWDSTLSFIALVLDQQYRSIKGLYNSRGHKICGPWELQHGASYIAVGYHEKFIHRKYKIKEKLTETWKNSLNPSQRPEQCLHYDDEASNSWKQKLQWKHSLGQLCDYKYFQLPSSKCLEKVIDYHNFRNIIRGCIYPSSPKISLSSTFIIPSEKYGYIQDNKCNNVKALFNPYKENRKEQSFYNI